MLACGKKKLRLKKNIDESDLLFSFQMVMIS